MVVMIRSSRALTPARRDAALRRLRVANRLLVGAAVVGTGVLAEVASAAFTGHARPAKTGRLSAQAAPATARSGRRSRRAAATTAAPAPATTPAPAPAPLVSGGS